LAHRFEQVERSLGMAAQKLVEIVLVDLKGLDLLDDLHRRSARAAVEQRQLAEEVAGARGLQHDARAGVVLEKDLDGSFSNDEHRIAWVAIAETGGAGRKPHHVELTGEKLALCFVEKLKKRHFCEQCGRGRHESAPSADGPSSTGDTDRRRQLTTT